MANSDFQHSVVYGESALGNIKKHKLPAVPKFYKFWYSYHAGLNPDLNVAVDHLVDEKGQIYAGDIESLYSQYLARDDVDQRLNDVGDRMSVEIDQLADDLSENVHAVNDYDAALEGVQHNLESISDPGELRQLIAQIGESTRYTAAANAGLKKRLQQSTQTIAALRQSMDTILHESLTDQLTGLNNRKQFDQVIERLIGESRQSSEPLSLLMTDIDFFKKFNDDHGHQTGDKVLRLVARTVEQTVKGQDIACRYGGEEFAILLPNTPLDRALSLADNIRKAVKRKELIKKSDNRRLGRISLSIGASSWRPGDNSTDLVARADAALYVAKRSGRDQVCSENDTDSPPAAVSGAA